MLERMVERWRRRKSAVGLAALALIAASPTRASAQPPVAAAAPAAGMAQIWFRSTAGCPDGETFLQLLARLGRAASLAGVGDRVDFVVSLASAERESSGRLERQSREGTVAIRDFVSPSCVEVAEVLALSLDLALQPPATVAPAEAEPEPVGFGWGPELGVQASLESGLARTLLPGAALFIGLGPQGAGWDARLSLRGAYGEREGLVALHIGLLAARAEGCWSWALGALELGPCAGVDLGLVRADSSGDGARTDAGGWSAATGHVRARWQMGRVALEAQAGALAPFVRYDFQAVVGGTVTSSAALGFSASLGGAFRF